MTKLLPLTAALWALSFAPAPPEKFTFVDLEPYANQKLTDNFGSGADGNDLGALLKSGRTFSGVNFKFGKGVIQLDSPLLAQKKPSKVEGIKVGKTCAKLHIIHATGYGNAQQGSPLHIADDTKIAEYKIHYDDGTSATIPVVYGQDVRDWWYNKDSPGVTRGKVAWKGSNERAKELNNEIRLYMATWENPHPNKKVATIDYLKTGDGPAAPFCVAITLESK
jgi:hypothetical protein